MDLQFFYDNRILYTINGHLLADNEEQDIFYAPNSSFLMNNASLPLYATGPFDSSAVAVPYFNQVRAQDPAITGLNGNGDDLIVELPSAAAATITYYGGLFLESHDHFQTTMSFSESHSHHLQYPPDYSNSIDEPPTLLHDEGQHHVRSSTSNNSISGSSINDSDDLIEDDEDDVVEEEKHGDDDDDDTDWPPATVQAHQQQKQQQQQQRHEGTQSSVKCTNCEATDTPLWRRNGAGEPLCNACGLFLKLHGEHRPISLKTNVIKRRRRHPKDMAHPKRRRPSSKKRNRNSHGVVKK